MNFSRALLTILLVFNVTIGSAKLPVEIDSIDSVEVGDTTDAEMRINPVILFDGGTIDSESVPSFIRRDENVIKLNGADWSGVKKAAANSSQTKFCIVHIGDSHIQAGISAEVIRENLQLDLGNGGRGLLSPLRLSGTNQPWDYKFDSSGTWFVDKVMREPWKYGMGFNGTALTMKDTTAFLHISTNENDEEYDPFSTIELFWEGNGEVMSVQGDMEESLRYTVVKTEHGARVRLVEPVTSVRIELRRQGRLTLHCAAVYNDRPGAVFHTIGNNGATFSTYNHIGTTASGVNDLTPDLIIVSLGTNEAFGRLDVVGFRRQIDTFISDLKRENPTAAIMLVTPMECQRRGYVRRGRRRRRLRKYSVNTNILPLRNAILQYGVEKNIAVYDWYEIAGGAGASAKWLGDKLMGSDRVHHTASGYRLVGLLLYEAIIKSIVTQND